MAKYSYVLRLSAALTMVTVSLLFLAYGCGLIPDAEVIALESRCSVAKLVGLQAAAAVEGNDPALFERALKEAIDDESELRSGGLRDNAGHLVAQFGGHDELWIDPGEHSTPTHVWLTIELNGQPWGRAEFTFRPAAKAWLGGLWPGGAVGRLFAFVGAASFGCFASYLWYVLGRVLSSADAAIPHRVRQALDVLAEGVVVLDKRQRIALANLAFVRMSKKPAEALIGLNIAELGWARPRGVDQAETGMPWELAAADGATRLRIPVVLRGPNKQPECTLSVNATPILDERGARQGMLTTFDDMTELERKNSSLQELLQKLKHSRAEIHRQNQELKTLATRDPLTLCLNRRAFFFELNPLYEQAARVGAPLSCIMIDVDRFKQINDRHGHATGDQVLFQVAELLRARSRNTDLVCRYGGEEFALVLPQTDLEAAAVIAERTRAALAEKPLAGVNVTASFGLSAISLGPNGPQGLLDQADQAMYAAKRGGRNRVVRFTDLAPDAKDAQRPSPLGEVADAVPVNVSARPETAIPYPAVTALISALAYRDTLTAEHSRRVADMCVRVGKEFLSQSECYLLEVAALLHDIGKLGVPDAILFKPGPLTEDEWKVMRLHDRMGVEIITAAFASDALTRIVATHHAWFGGSPRDPSLPTGQAIPLPGRILAIADAFDAMVSDRAYRKGRSYDEAFKELRRCAGTQFDPDLIEKFIATVQVAQPVVDQQMAAISKETALLIGTQIERLAGAIDEQDVPALATMATQLVGMARDCGIPAIIDVAGRLERAATGHTDWHTIVAITHDLLELCRSTQSIYLRDARVTSSSSWPKRKRPAPRPERRTDTPLAADETPDQYIEALADLGAPTTERLAVPSDGAVVTDPPTEIMRPTGDSSASRSAPRPVVVTIHD